MADLDRTISIIFEGVDRMGAGVDSATRRIDGFTGKVEQVAEPVANMTKSLLAAEAAMGALAIAFGKKALDEATKFESSIADLEKTLSDGEGTALSYASEIKLLSNEYGESSADLLQTMANYKQAGFTAEESLGLVKDGLDLVIAGDVDAARASEILVQSLKGFKAPASEANTLLEVLNASSNTYATDVEQLASGMGRLSPIASSMGLTFEDTAELLIPVIEVFRSGPEAANALRTGLLKLGDDSKPVATALETLGVKQRDANGVLRSSSDILADVAAATGDMAESEKLFIAQQLFGIEQSAKMVEVLGSLENSSIDVNQALKDSSSVAEEVAIRLATAEKTAERTATAFDNMAGTIGGKFLTEMTGVNDAIGEIFRALDGEIADGALDGFFDEFSGLLSEVERLALEIAEALPEALENADYSGFADGLQAIFGDLENVEITDEDVTAVIESLADGFRSLSEFSAGTIEVFSGFAQAVAPLIKGFAGLDSETQQWLGVIGGLSIVVSPVIGVIGGLTTVIGGLAGASGILPVAIRQAGNFAGVLGRFAGPAGAAVLAYNAIGDLRDQLEEFNEFKFTFSDELEAELDKTSGVQKESTELSLYALQKIAEAYGGLSDYFGWGEDAAGDFKVLSGAAIDAANQVAASAGDLGTDGGQELERLSQTAINMAKLVGQARDEFSTGLSRVDAPILDQFSELPDSLSRVANILDQGGSEVTASAEAVGNALNQISEAFSAGEIDASEYERLKTALLGLRDGADAAVKGQEALAGEVLSSEEAILKARDAVLQQELALEELASNERIQGMEFAVDFKIAQLENDTKRVEAILSATSETIASTADAAASIFGTLGDGDLSLGDSFIARDAIDQQLEIQQQAADQQSKLIDAQVQSLNAKTRALQQGDGLIKIESDGLEPALEMIMWEVLEKIQMRANAEGAEFLLGL